MEKPEWEAPLGYTLDEKDKVADLAGDLEADHVIDPIDQIANDLFEYNYPSLIDDVDAKARFCAEVKAEGNSYGEWFYYPWNNSVVRFPENDDYYNLRTSRNRDLITKDEQQVLRTKRIAIFGLSVGSNVIDSLTQTGIGNEYMLSDPDRLSVSNLNRIRANMGYVGLLKTTVAGRKMAELDPYIKQSHFPDGYNENSNEVLMQNKPDIIVEDTDDLETKARVRDIAMKLGVAVLTVGDVGDRVVLDVERYDNENAKPFNGKISKKQFDALVDEDRNLSRHDQESILMKLLGFPVNFSPRFISSCMKRGTELSGFPQLGTTASIGGSMAAVAVRDILLNREVKLGTRVEDVRKAAGTGRSTTPREDLGILHQLIRYRKKS